MGETQKGSFSKDIKQSVGVFAGIGARGRVQPLDGVGAGLDVDCVRPTSREVGDVLAARAGEQGVHAGAEIDSNVKKSLVQKT